MDKVSFIVETLANINQSILLIYFLCGTLNVNKKINSKIAVISGVSIIFAYLEIQYMVVPFEGLGVGTLYNAPIILPKSTVTNIIVAIINIEAYIF